MTNTDTTRNSGSRSMTELADKIEAAGWEPNEGELPQSWVGHCNDCWQPITGEPAWKVAFYWLCYRLLLAWPDRWMPHPILPYAGAYAFACRCKNRAAALRAGDTDAG